MKRDTKPKRFREKAMRSILDYNKASRNLVADNTAAVNTKTTSRQL